MRKKSLLRIMTMMIMRMIAWIIRIINDDLDDDDLILLY